MNQALAQWIYSKSKYRPNKGEFFTILELQRFVDDKNPRALSLNSVYHAENGTTCNHLQERIRCRVFKVEQYNRRLSNHAILIKIIGNFTYHRSILQQNCFEKGYALCISGPEIIWKLDLFLNGIDWVLETFSFLSCKSKK